jgi:oligogalacturonide lyase
MKPLGGPGEGCSRRVFLFAVSSACVAATESGKGRTVPSAWARYADPSTEFQVIRLTNPQFSSFLPRSYCRPISRKSNFLIFSSDMTGRMEAYRLDLKSGVSHQLTEASNLDHSTPTLSGDERTLYYLDGHSLQALTISGFRSREVYRIPDGFEPGVGFSVAEDGLYAALVERPAEGKSGRNRLRLVRIADGMATTLTEADEELADPIPRPRRASVIYRRGDSVWLANYDGQQNYRLKVSEGAVAEALWSPDGRSVLYLNIPADPHKLRNLREDTPDTNEDKALANTTQYACFERNADASVFVGASGSKASPHVLLLVRSVRREFTLCEHRASDPRMVSPIFAPNSQHVYFVSDQHGKPALYTMAIEKLVTETDEAPNKEQ